MVQLGGLSWVNTILLVQSHSLKMSEITRIAHTNQVFHVATHKCFFCFNKISFGVVADVHMLSFDLKLTDETDIWIECISYFLSLRHLINHLFPQPERLLINAPSFHFPLVRVTSVIRK